MVSAKLLAELDVKFRKVVREIGTAKLNKDGSFDLTNSALLRVFLKQKLIFEYKLEKCVVSDYECLQASQVQFTSCICSL